MCDARKTWRQALPFYCGVHSPRSTPHAHMPLRSSPGMHKFYVPGARGSTHSSLRINLACLRAADSIPPAHTEGLWLRVEANRRPLPQLLREQPMNVLNVLKA